MTDIAISTKGLSRKFGKKLAVNNLNLEVPTGSVFGLLGPNGSGKSTTINMVMGILPVTNGNISLLGLDPAKQGIAIRQRVGYVPENYGYYEWMKVDELISLVAAYHSSWNWTLSNQLLMDFGLGQKQKVSELSKGMRAKLALLLALSFEPEMLVLDEPTGGLDPAARRNFIETILACYQESGKTILLSSHLLNEFAGLLDHVAFIREGQLVSTNRLEDLQKRMKRVRLIFGESIPEKLEVGEALSVKKNGREAIITCSNFDQDKTQQEIQQSSGADSVIIEEMTLEDIFVDLVGS